MSALTEITAKLRGYGARIASQGWSQHKKTAAGKRMRYYVLKGGMFGIGDGQVFYGISGLYEALEQAIQEDARSYGKG